MINMDKADSVLLSNGDSAASAEICGEVAIKEVNLKEESMNCRILKTVALYLSFAALGFAAPIFGLSIVHMEYILNSTTQIISFTFTCHALGYTLGGIFCGFIYDHVNREFAFSAAVLTSAVSTIIAGFVGHIYAFMAFMLLQGVAMGFIDAAGQSYCVNLWQNHRFKEPILQAAHAIWSLAATIGPFVVRPFLVELSTVLLSNTTDYPMANMNMSTSDSMGSSDNFLSPITYQPSFSTVKLDTDVKLSEEMLAKVAMAQYAYLAIGCIIFCAGILFVVLYFYGCEPVLISKSPIDVNKVVPSKTKLQKQRKKFLLITFFVMLFIFYFLYIYIEGIPLDYFTAFMIKHLNWSVHSATLVMACFFAFHCAGRVIGVPLSAFLKPRTMLIINLVITAAAYVLLLFVNLFDSIMWISSILAGFGMSSTFATMVLWVSETVPITGRVASILLVGGSVGGMTGPLLVGQLFDVVSPMCMVYVLVTAAVLHIILFALLMVYVTRWKSDLSSEVDIMEHEVVDPSESLDMVKEKQLQHNIKVDSNLP